MAGGRNIKYMRRDCINAVENFIKAVQEKLPYAAVHTEGVYYANRNVFLDSTEKEKRSKGDKGARLGIILGGGDRDVTSYMFHMRDLSDPKNANAKSLRYTPNDKKPAILAARSFPDATIGEIEQLDTDGLTMSAARMMNSISFDAMFQGWGGAILKNTEEERSLQRIVDAGESGGWDALVAKCSDPEPLNAMSAWGYMGLLTQDEDPDSPIMTNTAIHAMGLDALFNSLKDLNGRIAADPDYQPDLSEYLDPDTDMGRRSLRGLVCLSAFKEARDHGGIDVLDDAGKHIIGIDLDNPDTARVYDRLANTRANAELYQASLDRAEASRLNTGVPFTSVQSTFAGIAKETDKAPENTLNNDMLYRFYRCAMLGEDPDMPSGAPDLILSLSDRAEDLKTLSVNDILIDSSGLPNEARNMPFGAAVSKAMSDPDSPYGKLFAKFPVMNHVMALPGGAEKLEQLAVQRMQGTGGASMDGLALEADLFSSNKKKLCGVTKNHVSANSLCEQFQNNFIASHQRSPQLTRAMNASAGTPDFKLGIYKLGQCVLLDLDSAGALKYPDFAQGEGGNNPTRTARAFRRLDAERLSVCEYYTQATGQEPKSMAEAGAYLSERGGTGQFNHFMDMCHGVGLMDVTKAAMLQNDFIVLSDCYKIKSEDGLAKLREDIMAVYDGRQPDQRLYRPRSRAEVSALGAIYEASGFDWKDAQVPLAFQNAQEGFLTAAWRGGASNSEGVQPGVSKLMAAALDLDTLDDSPNFDLATRLSGPSRSVKMLMIERQQGAELEDQAGHGGHGIVD